MRLATVCLLLLTVAVRLAAQTPTDRPWSISATIGAGWGGPGADMGAHLEQVGGYDASGCGGFFGCFDYPSVQRPGAQWSIVAGRRLSGRIGVRSLVSGGYLGWTYGVGDSGTVSRHWSSTSVGVLLTIDVVPEFWVGAGPAVAWLRSAESTDTPGSDAETNTSLAIHLEAGLVTSARKPVFATLTLSYRFVPIRQEGPYPESVGPGELSPFDASYGRFAIGAGVGARFRLP